MDEIIFDGTPNSFVHTAGPPRPLRTPWLVLSIFDAAPSGERAGLAGIKLPSASPCDNGGGGQHGKGRGWSTPGRSDFGTPRRPTETVQFRCQNGTLAAVNSGTLMREIGSRILSGPSRLHDMAQFFLSTSLVVCDDGDDGWYGGVER
ncbi:hypothetical protein CCHR01_17587 [Colletotrichum chrysophilum]|uniref:Uncharacterized protein n=1 Tax=Colletotrichum chrysophilum TaxID=1836956 RepID=A0AAD9E8Y7_9PEZI|nr:hypothetical protein CCHR01_17587 [Colletotrichum chrysophilum]